MLVGETGFGFGADCSRARRLRGVAGFTLWFVVAACGLSGLLARCRRAANGLHVGRHRLLGFFAFSVGALFCVLGSWFSGGFCSVQFSLGPGTPSRGCSCVSIVVHVFAEARCVWWGGAIFPSFGKLAISVDCSSVERKPETETPISYSIAAPCLGLPFSCPPRPTQVRFGYLEMLRDSLLSVFGVYNPKVFATHSLRC